MQKKTCNKKNTRNKSKKRKHQEPPTTDVDCKEKQPTERTKTGGEGRRGNVTRRLEGRGRERQGEIGERAACKKYAREERRTLKTKKAKR